MVPLNITGDLIITGTLTVNMTSSSNIVDTFDIRGTLSLVGQLIIQVNSTEVNITAGEISLGSAIGLNISSSASIHVLLR